MARFTNDIVRVIVGDPSASPTEYHLNAFPLIHRSRFFRAALRGGWKEAAEKTIRLPEEHVCEFDRYLSLVFFGTVAVGNNDDKKVRLEKPALLARENTQYRKLLELYLLCDRLQDRKAQNHIIDAVLEQSQTWHDLRGPDDGETDNDDEEEVAEEEEEEEEEEAITSEPIEPTHIYPGLDEISLIFENTLKSAGMRRLLVDIWSYDPKQLEDAMGDGEDKWNNKAFLFSITKRSAQLSPLQQPDSEEMSQTCRCHQCLLNVKPSGILVHNYHEDEDEPQIVLDAEGKAATKVKEPSGDSGESGAEDTYGTNDDADVIETAGTDGIDGEVVETAQGFISDDVVNVSAPNEETVDSKLADVVVVEEGGPVEVEEGGPVEVSEGVEVDSDTATAPRGPEQQCPNKHLWSSWGFCLGIIRFALRDIWLHPTVRDSYFRAPANRELFTVRTYSVMPCSSNQSNHKYNMNTLRNSLPYLLTRHTAVLSLTVRLSHQTLSAVEANNPAPTGIERKACNGVCC